MVAKLRTLLDFQFRGSGWKKPGSEVVVPVTYWHKIKPPTLGGLKYDIADSHGWILAVIHHEDFEFYIHVLAPTGDMGATFTRVNFKVQWKNIRKEVEETLKVISKEF